jgi:hypothetical protein
MSPPLPEQLSCPLKLQPLGGVAGASDGMLLGIMGGRAPGGTVPVGTGADVVLGGGAVVVDGGELVLVGRVIW